MVAHTEYLWFQTPQRRMLVEITPELVRIAGKSGVKDGMMLVSATHITSGIWINNDDVPHDDLDEWLDELAPQKRKIDDGKYQNRSLIGHQVILPITAGKLDLSETEGVFYAEFDGQRKKRVVVKVMGE